MWGGIITAVAARQLQLRNVILDKNGKKTQLPAVAR